MDICDGYGRCIYQCGCECFDDEECEIQSEICNCEHKNHIKIAEGYCRKECIHNCTLVECHNFKFCGSMRPKGILCCHNGMCMNCAVSIGKITFLNEKDECPICQDTKDLIEISCKKHKFCLDCWIKWSENIKKSPLTCPLCSESIWKWKGK